MATIDNKFKGIRFDPPSEISKSEIIVRTSYNPLRFGGPIAIIKCGACETTYKKPLLFQHDYFCIDDDFKCKCGHTDNVTYRRKFN
jgi:hypothetical protein